MIGRRKLYLSELRDGLPRLYILREAADYKQDLVSEIQAARALQRARGFLQAIQQRGGRAG